MKLQKLFAGLTISSFGLSAQRKRMNAIAENIANAETTRTEDGDPYRRKAVSVSSREQQLFSSELRAADIQLTRTEPTHQSGAMMEFGDAESAPAVVEAMESEDTSSFKMVYDPGHPDADADGYVKMPNVNVVTEMVDMIAATRAYEANVVAINAAKTIAKDSLEI
jgi:flagellar basal-body rod protein FlgC